MRRSSSRRRRSPRVNGIAPIDAFEKLTKLWRDLVNIESYAAIRCWIAARYRPDADGELPIEYWDALSAAVDQLLRKAVELNQPVKAAG